MWSDHNGNTLEINNNKKYEKSPDIINFKNTIPNNSLIKKDITGKIEHILKWMKRKIQHMIYAMYLKQCLEGNLYLYDQYQKKRSQNNNLSFHLKKLDNHEQTKQIKQTEARK